jgi:pimeloyl-ACP methyl ester carboxylesterase
MPVRHAAVRPALAALLATLALSLPLAAEGAGAAETVVVASPRVGVVKPLLVQSPPQPRAVVLLFAGGHGGRRFDNDAPASFAGNFLVRSRGEFIANGMATAVVGAASDRQAPDWLTDGFRTGAEHALDVGAAVDALRARFQRPVWLVGTSRGTLSAAAAGLRLGRRIDGVVLAAGMTSVKDLDIDRFEVPVLLVHHVRDTCRVTDFRDLPQVRGRLKAPHTELVTFSGGRSEGPACEAMAYHGFNGIEADVVRAISRWIAPE